MFITYQWTSTTRIQRIRMLTTVIIMTVFSGMISQSVTYAAVGSSLVATDSSHDASLKHTIQITIKQLAQHSPFTSWAQASTKIQPLGAGTHGWLVRVLDHDNKPIGYLIFHAKEQGGYQLTEYGAGSELPYDHLALKQALKQHGIQQDSISAIEPVYFEPLIAAWKIQSSTSTKWIDAINGELLPNEWMRQLDKTSDNNVKLTAVSSSEDKSKNRFPARAVNSMRTTKVNSQKSNTSSWTNSLKTFEAQASIQGQSFDPYENILWMASSTQLRGKHALNWIQDWNPETSSKNWIYVVRKEQPKNKAAWNMPYAVIGKQQWTRTTPEQEIGLLSNHPSSFEVSKQQYWIVTGANTHTKRWLAEESVLKHGYVTTEN